jgi:ferredoxin-NADP reductase/Na+-translocating ferredoxin:NAD+ oxidoreductase RnfD subunit
MQRIDELLNQLTMYRLVVYALASLTATSIVFSFLGHLSSTPTQLVVSLALILIGSYLADRGLARLFAIPANMESALITALILFLIVQPAHSIGGGMVLVLAGAIASASKFLITWHGKHIFNPAAFAAAVLSLTGLHAITWWIGSSVLWPFALILGLAIVRKMRRSALFLAFAAVATILQVAVLVHAHQPIIIDMKHALLASPLIFLATFMLTEPATMPSRRNQQIVFAALVAGLYVTAFNLGPLIVYPEVALLLGNVFAFIVSPKLRIRMQLKEIQKISDQVYNYVFQPDQPFKFLPGQYMEWTLANVPYDARGNRRTFTIASSPTEDKVHLGLKYFEPASTYKKALHAMQPGDVVYGSQVAGNFTLSDIDRKLAFIAGGIGITPFRSMVKYLTDEQLQCDVVLLYVVGKAQEFAYSKELQAAASIGIKTIPIVTKLSYRAPGVVSAKLTADLIAELVPDYTERTFYISGSDAIVDASEDYLLSLGVSKRHINTDHFSGY